MVSLAKALRKIVMRLVLVATAKAAGGRNRQG